MRLFPSGVRAGFLLVLAFTLSVAAQSIRLVSWQSDDFPSPAAGAGTNDPDVRRLRQMAGVLRPYNADVIVVEGLADRPTGQKLAGFMKPANYSLSVFHVYRAGGSSNPPVAPSLSILTRRNALSARTVDWRTSGQIDSAGGFNFVSVPFGSNVLCFYMAQFVDAPAGATNARVAQVNLRKRELAAQYLLHHTRWIEGSLTNPLAAFILTGNLGVGPGAGDATIPLLRQAGFLRAAPLPGGEAGLVSAREWFARNATFNGTPQLGTPRGFSYGPVLTELSFKAPAPPSPAPVATAAPNPAAVSGPAPAPAAVVPKPVPSPESLFRKFPVDERLLWLAVPVLGACLLLLLLLLPYRWWVARRQSRALVRRRSRNAVVVDFAPPGTELEAGASAVAGALPEGTDGAWEERARDAEQRANKAAAVVREGLMPQLVRLMREKIFQRLSSQRAHLLDSHLNGTMAVLELEERLEKIQSQFATRLAAREQRIAELEAELAAKENIIRELIKAQARLAGRVSNDS